MKVKRLLVIFVLIITAFIAVSCSPSVSYSTNLLENAKFENGLSGWTTQENMERNTVFGKDSYEDLGETFYYASIENHAPNKAALRQRVHVERGETYEISVEIRIEVDFEEGGTGAHLSVAELPKQIYGVTASFGTLSPATTKSTTNIAHGWITYRMFVTADNVDYITVELRCGSEDGYSTGNAFFKNASMKKINLSPDQINYSKIKGAALTVSHGDDIDVLGLIFTIFFGLLFLAAAFLGYEFIARQMRKGDKKQKNETAPETKPEELLPSETEKEEPAPRVRKKISKEFSILLIALGVIFALKIVLGGLVYGNDSEFNLFSLWAKSTAKNGLASFYKNNPTSYTAPGYVYLLSFIGLFTQNMQAGAFWELMLLRLPAIIADIASAILIFFILKRGLKNQTAALAGALLYAVNIAVFANSAWYGQYDSILTAFLLLAVYMALTKNYLPACLSYAVAVLFKVQAIFILPVFVTYLVLAFLKNRDKRLTIGLSALFAFLGWFVLTLPMTINQIGGGDVFFIFGHYLEGMQIGKLSLNAFNFFGAIGFNNTTTNDIVLANWICVVMIALFVAFIIVLLVRYKGKGNVLFLMAGYLTAIIYTFTVNMRGYNLFPVIAFLLVASLLIRDRRLYLISVAYSILQFANYAGLMLTHTEAYAADSAFMIVCSILSMLVFAYFTLTIFDIMMQNKIKPIKNYTRIFK